MAILVEPELIQHVQSLETLSTSPPPLSLANWASVASSGQFLADHLRTDQLRTALGNDETGLVKSCCALLRLSSNGTTSRNDAGVTNGVTQLLRVFGNLCFDHDINRANLLKEGAVGLAVGVLADLTGLKVEPSEVGEGRTISLDVLKLLRAGVGALLNMSLGFQPIREELTQPATIRTLLALLDARPDSRRELPPVYHVGSWIGEPVGGVQQWKEKIEISSMVASWSLKIVDDLLADDKSIFPPECVPTLAVPILAPPPPTSPLATSTWDPEEFSERLSADLELLTTSAAFLESLSIDVESAKQAIAFSPLLPDSPSSSASTSHPSIAVSEPETTLLFHLLNFIEHANPPPHWFSQTSPTEEGSNSVPADKSFSDIKAALVRAVVETPNSDVVMDRLFSQDKHWVVNKLAKWIQHPLEGREDLIICAAHMLAALARKDGHCVQLLQDVTFAAPSGLAEPLSNLIRTTIEQQLNRTSSRPGEATQILFGLVSLARHLAIPPSNKPILGVTGIIESVALLLRAELDVVIPLQTTAVGLLKHLTAGNAPNALRLFSATPYPISEGATTPLDLIVTLIQRTSDVRLRSEATRILINTVRSLFASGSIPSGPGSLTPTSPTIPGGADADRDDELLQSRRAGRQEIVRKDVVVAISEMARLSERYPMLINEAIVGLTLIAGSGGKGALMVLDALLTNHPAPPAIEREPPSPSVVDSPTSLVPPSTPSATGSSLPVRPTPKRATSLALTSAGDPVSSCDMLVNWIAGASSVSPAASPNDASVVRPEMRANACALLVTVVRASLVAGLAGTGTGTGADAVGEGGEKVEKLKMKFEKAVRGADAAVEARGERETTLGRALRRAREVLEKDNTA